MYIDIHLTLLCSLIEPFIIKSHFYWIHKNQYPEWSLNANELYRCVRDQLERGWCFSRCLYIFAVNKVKIFYGNKLLQVYTLTVYIYSVSVRQFIKKIQKIIFFLLFHKFKTFWKLIPRGRSFSTSWGLQNHRISQQYCINGFKTGLQNWLASQ